MRSMAAQWGPNGNVKYFRRRPNTNAERQADFLKRNPGYYQKYQARYRAAALAARERDLAEYQQAEAIAAQQQQQSICRPMQLGLPAPAVAMEMEEINMMRQRLER